MEVKRLLYTLETLKVLSALKRGEKSFTELKKETGLARATLALRLRLLREEGCVERNPLRSFPPKTIYRLTKRGEELYEELVEKELKPEIEGYLKAFPKEITALAEKYMKLGK
jgi:DNA-binding HxlR family transcriptional regulator